MSLELPTPHICNFLHGLMPLILFSYDLCQGDSSHYSRVSTGHIHSRFISFIAWHNLHLPQKLGVYL